jgi:putative membrane-bound dehydrogenase-like protein
MTFDSPATRLGIWVFATIVAVQYFSAATVFAQGFPPDEVNPRLIVPDDLTATLYAAEPLVRQPNCIKFDRRGRLWVIQYLQYPNPAGLKRVAVDRWSRTLYDRQPEPPPHGPRGDDRVTILEDTDGDGRADSARDFVTGLNLATGLEFADDGVFVLQAPYLLFYPDRNRDDAPDGDPEVLLTGFGLEDAQSMVNHLTWGPDGWLYGVTGSTATNRVRDIEFQQAVWRYHPRSKDFELFCEGGGNLFGLTFDELGRMFFGSNGGHVCCHGIPGAYYAKAFAKHGDLHNPYAYGWFQEIHKLKPQLGGPTTGQTIYLGDHLPERYRGALIGGDFLGHTASWWTILPRASTFELDRGGTLLNPQDSWVGITDVCYGPDGTIYLCDFYDRRTAHPDPDANWDRSNGRIYRIGAKDRSVSAVVDMTRLTVPQLVEHLSHPSYWHRLQARRTLGERQTTEVIDELRGLALNGPTVPALTALWTVADLAPLDADLANQLLAHEDEARRAWGVRFVARDWDKLPADAISLTKLAAEEQSLWVLSELLSACQRLPGPVSIGVLSTLLADERIANDPQLPWQAWWGLERHAATHRGEVLNAFAKESVWNSPLGRFLLPLLVRRYAAEGSAEGEAAVLALWESCPAGSEKGLVEAVKLGVAERQKLIAPPGQGDLFAGVAGKTNVEEAGTPSPKEPVGPALMARLVDYWQKDPADVMRLTLAVEVGVPAAIAAAENLLREPMAAAAERVAALTALTQGGRPFAPDVMLRVLDPATPEALLKAVIRTPTTLEEGNLVTRLLELHETVPGLRSDIRGALFSRPAGALAFLREVEAGRIDPAKIDVLELRPLALFENPEIDGLVHKFWGTVRAGTPEEKLAEMRRMNNDLRAGTGDVVAGKVLFKEHCAICHLLHGEGKKVGPDLTNSSRHDREFLLTSLVDPSAVVRKEYTVNIVETASGQTFNGLVVASQGGELTLVDSRGETRTIAASDIEQLVPSPVSLMPEGLPKKLTPEQLRDLFAYLQRKDPLPSGGQ